jgi:hypothetical protein
MLEVSGNNICSVEYKVILYLLFRESFHILLPGQLSLLIKTEGIEAHLCLFAIREYNL